MTMNKALSTKEEETIQHEEKALDSMSKTNTGKMVAVNSEKDEDSAKKRILGLQKKLKKAAVNSKGLSKILAERFNKTKKTQTWDSKGHNLEMEDIERIHAELRRAMHRTNQICEELLLKHDRDHTGTLSKEELKRVFRAELRIPVQRLSDEEIDGCLDVLDIDGNGDLTIDELAQFIELGVGLFITDDVDQAPVENANDFYRRLEAREKKNKRRQGSRDKDEGSSKAITQSQVAQSIDLRNEAQILFDYAKGLKDNTQRRNMEKGYSVKSKLKQRIVTNEALASELLESIGRVEPSTYLMQMSIQQLQKARSNLWPELSIVKKRIKVRSHFRTAELERDYFQEAMIYEQQMLEEGRATLLERVEIGKDILDGLEKNRVEMVKVVDSQRDEVKDDRTALLVAQDKLMATHAMAQASSEAKPLRGQWKNIAYKLMEITKQLEEDATQFRRENERVMNQIADDASKAKQHCKDCLERHMLEMQRLMKQLEKEIYHSHHAVASVENTVNETRRRLDKTQYPQLTSQRSIDQISRVSRARSTIVDSVQTQQDKLEATLQGLHGQFQWAGALLEKLHESHNSLIQDHHAKSRALKIDEQCLRVTPDKEEDQFVRKRLGRAKTKPEDMLKPSQVDSLRAKIRAAASSADPKHPGVDMDKLFRYLSPGGSEELTDDQVRKAIRTKLLISKEVITDCQIIALCAVVDEDGSGTVSVQELAEFMAKDEGAKVKVRPKTPEKMLSAREKKNLSEMSVRPPEEELPILKKSVMETLRQKIKSQAAVAQEPLERMLQRFDTDNSGELEDGEIRKALRITLKIPKSLITDHEIFAWCHMLDEDKSGAIDIEEIVNWVYKKETMTFTRPE